MERMISLVGLVTMIAIGWAMSTHKRRVPWRILLGGLALQFAFALLILKTTPGQVTFIWMGDFFKQLLSYVDRGAAFMFDVFPRPGDDPLPPQYTLWRSFAFGVLPTVIFFSSLMSILYHVGFMQKIVQFFAWIMQRTLGTSGAESLSAAANIFVGQTEAPLVIRPYVSEMTMSELNAVMVGGFATIAGGVLAAYVAMGVNAGHLITASVISAPAALLMAKLTLPETEHSKTMGTVELQVEKTSINVVEAAATGASDGVKLALNIAGMLIAFVALVAMGNALFGWVGSYFFGFEGEQAWSMQRALGLVFAPLAFVMGIPWSECRLAGEILGTKTVLNEFVAFADLATRQAEFSERSFTILTYALAGFANFSSIGIQLGGIGGIAPERRSDLARLGLRAMIGGTLAAFMTACVAGLLI
ncbi:MAG: NupC/NupG family nucleoside CNT transporter [Acidobacteriota bacterium]|nr:NupC/NupG family nucleoside CNT transporter [Acidobacteriota bacterium]MDH3523443.1 NupC/NupG family nucleoside CNT transporter [Acidobacteriota bacterium]